ncbi:MAG: DUF3810 family protein [Vulcanimicrobiaceae bacterium]
MSHRTRTFWDALNVALIIVAASMALWPPTLDFLNAVYADEFYPSAQRAVTALTNALPFALGDVLVIVVVAGAIAIWVSQLRRSRAWDAWVRAVLRTCALASLLYIWFIVAWGWNYARPSLAGGLGYMPVTPGQKRLDQLESALAAAMNRAAPSAHISQGRAANSRAALEAARTETLRAIRVDPEALATQPKHWLFDPYFNAVGISGMFFPFTYETYVASDLLWFEYPFTVEHEWAHVAGIARESDANFVAAIATLESSDAIVHYSGLLEVYAALPRGRSDRLLSRLVLDDYAAMRRRDAERIVPVVSRLAWGTYDSYLKSQHVRTGVINYTEYVRLLFGTALGREALAHAAGAAVTIP